MYAGHVHWACILGMYAGHVYWECILGMYTGHVYWFVYWACILWSVVYYIRFNLLEPYHSLSICFTKRHLIAFVNSNGYNFHCTSISHTVMIFFLQYIFS